LENDGDGEMPRGFFRCDEEVELAQSLTHKEMLLAGSCVAQAVAEQAAVPPRGRGAAARVATEMRGSAVGRRCAPRMRPRAAPRVRRRRYTTPRRARAPARPDDDEPDVARRAAA